MYNEIQNPPQRYGRIDSGRLMRLLGFQTPDEVATWQAEAIGRKLTECDWRERRPEWTESVAVGGADYLERVTAELGVSARHREIEPLEDGSFVLRESPAAYNAKM